MQEHTGQYEVGVELGVKRQQQLGIAGDVQRMLQQPADKRMVHLHRCGRSLERLHKIVVLHELLDQHAQRLVLDPPQDLKQFREHLLDVPLADGEKIGEVNLIGRVRAQSVDSELQVAPVIFGSALGVDETID